MSRLVEWPSALWIIQHPGQAGFAAVVLAALCVGIHWLRGAPRLAAPTCGRCGHPRPPQRLGEPLSAAPCTECGAPAERCWHGRPCRSSMPLAVSVLLLAAALPAGAFIRWARPPRAPQPQPTSPSMTLADIEAPRFHTRSRHAAGELMSIRIVSGDGRADGADRSGMENLVSLRAVSVRIDGGDAPEPGDAPKRRSPDVRFAQVPEEVGSHVLEIDWEQRMKRSSSSAAASASAPSDEVRTGTWRCVFTVVAAGEPVIDLETSPAHSPWPDGKNDVGYLELTDLGSGGPESRQLVVLDAPPILDRTHGPVDLAWTREELAIDGDWWIQQDGREAMIGLWRFEPVRIIGIRIDPLRRFDLVFRPRVAPDAPENRTMASFAERWWCGDVRIPFEAGDLKRLSNTDDPTWVWRGKRREDSF